MAFLRDLQSGIRRNGAPLCIALIVISAINLLATFIYPTAPWNFYLAFQVELATSQPWTLLTYPYAVILTGAALLNVVFACWWLYGIGGSVERELGTWRFAIFWVLMTLLPALSLWLGMTLLHTGDPLIFLFLPLSAVTVAWATRNPNAIVNFMLIIPIQAKWLGFLTVGMVLFGYGVPHPQLGLLACVHLALVYVYAANYIPFLPYGTTRFVRNKQHWKKSERDDTYLKAVKSREMERQERDRLRKLLEGSISDDPEDKR